MILTWIKTVGDLTCIWCLVTRCVNAEQMGVRYLLYTQELEPAVAMTDPSFRPQLQGKCPTRSSLRPSPILIS